MNTKERNNLLYCILCLVLCLGLLTGCSTHSSMSYTFTVTVADGVTENVKVELDTSKGHRLTQEGGTFTVSDADGNELSYGFFLTEDMYDAYYEAASQQPDFKETTVNGAAGIVYSVNDSEWDYMFHVADSDVYVAVGNPVSQSSAQDVIALLTFTAE